MSVNDYLYAPVLFSQLEYVLSGERDHHSIVTAGTRLGLWALLHVYSAGRVATWCWGITLRLACILSQPTHVNEPGCAHYHCPPIYWERRHTITIHPRTELGCTQLLPIHVTELGCILSLLMQVNRLGYTLSLPTHILRQGTNYYYPNTWPS